MQGQSSLKIVTNGYTDMAQDLCGIVLWLYFTFPLPVGTSMPIYFTNFASQSFPSYEWFVLSDGIFLLIIAYIASCMLALEKQIILLHRYP